MPLPSQDNYHKNSRKKKKRPASINQAELIWGVHSVLEGLRNCPQAVREILVEKDPADQRLKQIIELAGKNGIPIKENIGRLRIGEKGFHKTSEGQRSQGVAALIELPILSLEQLLGTLAEIKRPPLLLALDSIQDPHNLGAIIRSAAAAGADGIILPKNRAASITGTVIKISAGAVYHINICRVTNLVSCFEVLKSYGLWIFGTAKEKAQSVFDTDLTVSGCFVIGSEGKGLRPLVANQCDFHITIPMQSSLDSLNASVAAGIILFEAVRQRGMQLK